MSKKKSKGMNTQRIKEVMTKTAQNFGRSYGFTKAEIEEIIKESYSELMLGLS